MREARSASPWVSASRDSDATTASFRAWLDSLPIDSLSKCFVITGPHAATEVSWGEALQSLLSSSGEVFVLLADLRSVVTLSSYGVARFTSTEEA
jgi:hypothetical protein